MKPKIRPADKKKIIELHEKGWSFNRLSLRYGVSDERIRQIYMNHIYNLHKHEHITPTEKKGVVAHEPISQS